MVRTIKWSVLQDPTSWDTMHRVSEPIDQKQGTVNVYELLPEPGDSMMIVNCGTHYEIRHHHWARPPLVLTDEDIEKLKQGRIIWN